MYICISNEFFVHFEINSQVEYVEFQSFHDKFPQYLNLQAKG